MGNAVRKMGNTWRDEYHFEDSLAIYAHALVTLGDPAGLEGNAEQKWWQCWIQVQIEIQNVYYWLAWIEKSDLLFQQLTPYIEHYATFMQRAVFYQITMAARLRANRYVANEEIIAFAENALAVSIKAGISERIPADQFGFGFSLFHYGDLDRAEKEISSALRLAEQRGDLSLETRCLTYLTIVRRKKRDVGQALSLAHRALAAAESAENA